MARKKRPGESNPRREGRPGDQRPGTPASDYLLDAAKEQWPHMQGRLESFSMDYE